MVIQLKRKMFLNALKMFVAYLGCKILLMCLCYPSQQMKNASENILIACYSNHWYEFKPKIRSLLLVMMIRALRPCCLTACLGVQVNFSTVTYVVKTTMSYIAALMSVQA
uniref:Uncharacterized protein n=1 Tax=Trichogramma kaykai TaxID=54128 RepID=A0ABD2XPL7_9HYME